MLFSYQSLNFENLAFLFLFLLVIAGVLLFYILTSKHSVTESSVADFKYLDLGKGKPWFYEYEKSGMKLEDFLGLNRSNSVKIIVTVDGVASYLSPDGKKYVVLAYFIDQNSGRKTVFQFPVGDIDPGHDLFGNKSKLLGSRFGIFVDPIDYSKYSNIII